MGKIVATPHFYPQSHNLESFLLNRSECANRLSDALPEGAPKIYLGAEVLVCPGLERLDGLTRLCTDGTKTLLLEMPLTSRWSETLYETVYNISLLDVDIVLAHVDRYPHENVKRLTESTGARMQINASAFRSFFNRRKIDGYLGNSGFVAVGSDIHGADKVCARDMGNFLKQKKISPEHIFEQSEKYLIGAKSIN